MSAAPRILVMGNSHVACLRQALKARDRWSDHLSFHTLGAHGEGLLETGFKDGVMVPTTDGSRRSFAAFGGGDGLRLADFDGLVIAGGQMALARAVFLYGGARWPGLPGLAQIPDIVRMPQQLVSDQAVRAALRDTLDGSLAGRLIAHLRGATDLPIWVASQPRAAAKLMKLKGPKSAPHRAVLRNGDGPTLSALFDQVASEVCAAKGATWLCQPEQTRHKDILTAWTYTVAAPRLAQTDVSRQPAEDYLHANADYGAIVLDQIVEAVT